MEIRKITESDRDEIVRLYQKSQAATHIPNPDFYPPDSLDTELYSRDALDRYVAVMDQKIVGHGLIENPNPISLDFWLNGMPPSNNARLLELGGAFVDPDFSRKGIYSELLSHRLNIIRKMGAIAVSATWITNIHVQRQFMKEGGEEVARQKVPAGVLCLFIFK